MKILLVEDDLHTSELVSATLSAHRYAVDAIADGAAALDLITQWSYDLILLDIMLPSLNGIDLCRRLRTHACDTPILMLSAKDSTDDIVAGLDAGADDYLVKSGDSCQLLARMRALLRRSGNISAAPRLSWGLLCLDPASARVTYDQVDIALRPKEYTLLELFLRYPRRIFSRSAIVEHLWSMEDTPVEGSITNLIKDLRQRLKSIGMGMDLIETVYGLGYRLKEAPEKSGAIAPPPTYRPSSVKQSITEQGCADHSTVSKSVLAEDCGDDGAMPEPPGMATIQRISDRFHQSLKHRIAALEAAERSLQAGQLSFEQRKIARTEVHKLAGGLGTFGCDKASEIAQAIEALFDANLSQESLLTDQLSQLLHDLKQELEQSPTPASIS
jgi:DNA-binding response OmpR family regulator/HPt (histidine-containing phosphotransfer) domain-containing protein